MRAKNIYIFLLVIFILSGCSYKKNNFEITKLDKEIVLSMVLEKAIIDEYIADYSLLENEEIIISEENIEKLDLPNLEGVSLVMQSNNEIQQKADKEGDYLFLKITQFELADNKITISISNMWAVGKHSQNKYGYLSGGGFQISYVKSNGTWIQDEKETMKFWMS